MDQLTIQHLLSAALPSISNQNPPPQPKPSHKVDLLLSQDPPLSIPLLSASFRRFIIRVSPVFYVQDRVEEVVLWRRGWRVSVAWMAAWGMLCYYPRLFLALPHIILISLILNRALNPSPHSIATRPTSPEQDWQANLQAIQNLMLHYSDAYDALSASPLCQLLKTPPISVPLLPVPRPLTTPAGSPIPMEHTRSGSISGPKSPDPDAHQDTMTKTTTAATTPTKSLLPLLLLTLPIPPLISYLIPIQILLLTLGWAPILLGHPYSRKVITQLLKKDDTSTSTPLSSPVVATSAEKDGHGAEPFVSASVLKDLGLVGDVLGKAVDSSFVKRVTGNECLRRTLEDVIVIDPKLGQDSHSHHVR